MAITLATKIRHRYSNDRLKEILKNMPMVQMRIGWDKNKKEENGMRTAEVAYLNEVGHYIHHANGKVTHIVERPFMRLSCEMLAGHWHNTWRAYFRQYMAGEIDSMATVAQRFCETVIDDIRRVITEEKPFARNYRTNKKTGKREELKKTPLIDEGTMVASMTQEIHIAR